MHTARMHDKYIELGWRLIPIKKEKKKHAGSVLGKGWQNKSSSKQEDIDKWFSDDQYDVALHLGPHSGVIDVESDTPAGNELASKLFSNILTPAFRSARSTHYLFKWDSRFDSLKKTKYVIQDVEYRLGGQTAAHKPKGCISVIPPSDGREWELHSIQPNGMELANLPEDIIQLLLGQDQRSKPVRMEPVQYSGEGTKTGAQIANYLASAGPAISGQGGHNHTFRLSCKVVRDWDCSLKQAWPLFQEWNKTCIPPWDEEELFRKLDQAREHGNNEFGCDLGERTDVNIEHIAPRPLKKAPPAPQFPDNCKEIPGLIGDIVKHNFESAKYRQPELALAGAIALMSVITGRKIETNDGCRTNLYVLGLCGSGTGKDYAIKLNQIIMEEVGPLGERHINNGEIGSASGVITSLVRQPALLFQEDEFGHFLRSTNNARSQPYLAKVVSLMLKLWSVSNRNWTSPVLADSRKVKKIAQPHCCVFGTSTHKVFWESLSHESVTEGFLGRMLLFRGIQKAISVKGERPIVDVPSHIVEQITWWLDGELNKLRDDKPQPIFVKPNKAAQERFDDFSEKIELKCEEDENIYDSIWRRSIEKVLKLALIFAASKHSFKTEMEIDLDDVNRAIALSNYMTRTMKIGIDANVTETEYEKKQKEILGIIENHKGKMSVSELGRVCRKYKQKERGEILDDLQSQGKIIMEKESQDSGGRAPTIITRLY